MERLEKGEITDALRCEVVTSICVPWYQDCAYPSKEDYTAVSKQLVQKYPVLKESYGNGYVSVFVHVRVCACVCGGCVGILYVWFSQLIGIMETADPKKVQKSQSSSKDSQS